MESFLKDVERRAFRIARYSTGDADEALDLVQDAMLKLVRSYADKEAAEWPPLFYRILDNGITDWYRKRAVRGKVMDLFQGVDDARRLDPVEIAPDPAEPGPERRAATEEALDILDAAIGHMILCSKIFSSTDPIESPALNLAPLLTAGLKSHNLFSSNGFK